MRADAMSAEEEAGLVKRAKAGDARATDILVRANMWLCRLRASALKGYGIPMDDMVQQGAIGILKAVQRFDPALGARFPTFAMQWIRSETTAYATSKAWLVKGLSTGSQRKVFFRLAAERRRLGVHEGYLTPAQIKDVAARLEVSVADVAMIDERVHAGHMRSVCDRKGDDADDCVIVDERPTPEDAAISGSEERHGLALIAGALSALTDRERHILRHRRLCEKPLRLKDLAAELGISAERVRLIEERAWIKAVAAGRAMISGSEKGKELT